MSRNKLSDERIRHMHGVAEYMYKHAKEYNLNPDEMYLLGLLHDIGYIINNKEHEVIGARFLEEQGYKYSDIISWHGVTPQDYMRLRDVDSVCNDLKLLWKADMSVNCNGLEVSYDKRLFEIGLRHGFDGVQYRKAKEAIEWLKEEDNIQ